MKINMNKYIKIISIILLIIVIFIPINDVNARINPETKQPGEFVQYVENVFGLILTAGAGPLTGGIALLFNAILGIVFTLLMFLFSPISNGFAFPFPDDIIFNKVAFFDPNFINPTVMDITKNAPNVLLGDVIKNLYYTSFVIAGAVFIIAAMVIGLKLAISTIASEKAHYKQALVTWVTGLFLLFTTHFIMLFVFTVNEEIVSIISQSVAAVEVNIQILKATPLVGRTLSGLVNVAKGIIGKEDANLGIEKSIIVYGYSGILIRFAAYAFAGDLLYSIACGILLGQTVALIIMYIKRLFYAILLGMIAPLIVAADIMKKTM